LSDPFWAEAARHYQRIRIVPSGNQAHWWEEVAVYAATMGLETDAVYLARLDPQRVAERIQRADGARAQLAPARMTMGTCMRSRDSRMVSWPWAAARLLGQWLHPGIVTVTLAGADWRTGRGWPDAARARLLSPPAPVSG
jgi:hypothetical protein